jgi:glycosyltransferase involved in cell wall biosynthesis
MWTWGERGGREQLRLLVVIAEMPPIRSGIARSGSELVQGLSARGHEVDVIAAPELPRWTYGEVRFSGLAARLPGIRRRLPQYDVVNVHGPTPTLSDAFLAFSQTISPLRRPPLVYTHHSSIELINFPRASAVYRRLHGRLMRYADRVIVTTESYRQIVEQRVTVPVDLVPWGVDATRFASTPRPPRRKDEPLKVLFVGQLRPYKGLDVLAHAVAGDDRLQLTVVGDGILRDWYRGFLAHLGAANVRVLSTVEDSVLARLYGENDVIVLPSTTRAEAFGLVLLEGMAAGCIPVASNLPGVRDVARATGILVQPGDAAELRSALLRLAADPVSVVALSRASREQAEQMTWTGAVDAYERIFFDVADEATERLAALALPKPLRPPQEVLDDLVRRFRASWGSLLLFESKSVSRLRAAWGRFSVEELRRVRPRIAEHVARTRQPLILGNDTAPTDLRLFLRRSDIASSLVVPLRTSYGSAVLNLSIAEGVEELPYGEKDLSAVVELLSV